MFYAEPAAIRLIRRNGPLVRPETAQDDELLDDDDCVEIDDDSIARPDPRAVRSCRGGSQGCALAGLMACMPYQEVLHGVQRRHPTLRIVCLADDTYINDAPNTLYQAYQDKRDAASAEIGVQSNMDKVCAYSPCGDMAATPAHIRGSAQGPRPQLDCGVLNGLEVVGAYVGDATWIAAETAKLFTENGEKDKFAQLARILSISDTETMPNSSEFKYLLLRYCAAQKINYWLRCMGPTACEHAAAAADARTEHAFLQLLEARHSPDDEAHDAAVQCHLPITCGGFAIFGAVAESSAAWAASVAACWPIIQTCCHELRSVNMANPAEDDIPLVHSFNTHYNEIARQRDQLEQQYKDLDTNPCYTRRGGKLLPFRPRGLPTVKSLPPILAKPSSDPLASTFTTASQRSLAAVGAHATWARLHDRLGDRDADRAVSGAEVHEHREQARLVASSQPGAGMYLNVIPVSRGRAQPTAKWRVTGQRRAGLFLSDVVPALCTVRAAEGCTPEPSELLGDTQLNLSKDKNTRHNTANANWVRAKQAVAVHCVLMGDKSEGKAGRYKKWNAGHVFDICETGAGDSGKDRLSETKCFHSYPKSTGQNHPEFLGHIYSFANFEEGLRITILGSKRRGRQTENRFSHTTGRGFYKGHVGHYDDARFNHGHTVVCLIHAEDGGFSPETYSHIKRLARDASKTGGRDGTEYDDDNWNARSYLTHHMQRISSDIVMATADQLTAAINITKRSATGAAY